MSPLNGLILVSCENEYFLNCSENLPAGSLADGEVCFTVKRTSFELETLGVADSGNPGYYILNSALVC